MVNGNRGSAKVFNTFHRVFNKLYKGENGGIPEKEFT